MYRTSLTRPDDAPVATTVFDSTDMMDTLLEFVLKIFLQYGRMKSLGISISQLPNLCTAVCRLQSTLPLPPRHVQHQVSEWHQSTPPVGNCIRDFGFESSIKTTRSTWTFSLN